MSPRKRNTICFIKRFAVKVELLNVVIIGMLIF